jgi:hypothetical protein
MDWPWQKPVDLQSVISPERYLRYLMVAGFNARKADKLYTLNTEVSACFYVSLQMLEVALRNQFHARLTDAYGADWYDQNGVITTQHHRRDISGAKIDLVMDRKPLEPGRIVASLTFGFWTACLGTNYENKLWRPALSKAFPNKPANIQRKAINKELTPIRLLRNRIAHHEPILYLNLPKHHANIMKMIGWLSNDGAKWTAQRCRFKRTYDSRLADMFRNP